MDFHLYSVVISLKVRFFLTFYQKPHVNFTPRLVKSLSENFVKNFLYNRTVFLLSESSCSDSAAYAGFSPLRVESFIVLTESFKMMWELRVRRFCAFHTVGGVFLVLVWFFAFFVIVCRYNCCYNCCVSGCSIVD